MNVPLRKKTINERNTAKKMPLAFFILLSMSMCFFLGYSFHVYEPAIQYNGDTMEYWKEASQISAMHEEQKTQLAGYYPPLASVVFYAAYHNLFGLPFHQGLLLMIVLCAILAISFIVEVLHKNNLRYVIIAVPAIIVLLEPIVFFARFDFFPMLTILLVWLCMTRERYAWVGAFLVTGLLLKFSPIFLAPLVIACTPTVERKTLLKGALLASGILGILIIFVLTFHGAVDVVSGFIAFRSVYPPYVFSTVSSVDLFVRMLLGMKGNIQWIGPNIGHFNMDFSTFIPSLLQILSILGSVFIASIAGRDVRCRENFALYLSAVMLWVLATTPLLTMHYYLWVLPITFAWFLEHLESTGRFQRWPMIIGMVTITISLLGQYFYPYAYFDLVDKQTNITVTLNVVRNMLTIFLAYACLKVVWITKSMQNS